MENLWLYSTNLEVQSQLMVDGLQQAGQNKTHSELQFTDT